MENAARQPQVVEKKNQIERAVGTLQEKVKLIQERLAPILMPPIPKGLPGISDTAKESILVPHAAELKNIATSIYDVNDQLQDIFQRIEL